MHLYAQICIDMHTVAPYAKISNKMQKCARNMQTCVHCAAKIKNEEIG